jgi:hypothetical protein
MFSASAEQRKEGSKCSGLGQPRLAQAVDKVLGIFGSVQGKVRFQLSQNFEVRSRYETINNLKAARNSIRPIAKSV